MRRLWVISICLALQSCGGSSSDESQPNPTPPVQTGMLRPAASASELEQSLKAGILSPPVFDGMGPNPILVSTTGGPPPAPTFTTTYTAESNVDELDTVRYDGARLFIAPRRVFHCCVAMPASNPSMLPTPVPRHSIRVLETNPAAKSAAEVGEIALAPNDWVQGMYASGNEVIALTAESYYGGFGEFWTSYLPWTHSSFAVRIFDVANPNQPRESFTAKIDGVFVTSRRIDDRVYVVSRHTPEVVIQSTDRSVIESQSLASMLPKITISGVSRSLVDPTKCYLTNEAQGHGYPVITSITVFSTNNPSAISSVCFNEASSGVYLSADSLYLAEPRSAPGAEVPKTRIHKFALTALTPSYSGSVEIDGHVWTGGQRDFHLSEHESMLRVLTTQRAPAGAGTLQRLFVVRQKPAEQALEIVAQLPNERRPQAIGKPGESVHGVRFVGDRAFVVTFRAIDPLYAIDLSNPADPFIAAELILPGFADFLHPVTDNLLLSLGYSEDWQIKLELFDVSSLAQPLSRGLIHLGGSSGGWSEAVDNRHAFTYLPGATDDRFAIPAALWSGQLDASGLFLFEIKNKNTPASASMNRAGEMLPTSFVGSDNRSYLHDDTVYFVSNGLVWAADWHSPSALFGPF